MAARRRRFRFSFVLASAVLLPLQAVLPADAGSSGDAAGGLPVVSPAPQSMKALSSGFEIGRTVDLVTTSDKDRAAVAATQRVLTGSGSGSRTTVYVGGPKENPASAQALKDLGVDGPDGLPPGGYVLAIGDHKVVLAGVDAAGTFYAAQTLRQLVRSDGRRTSLPGVVIQDFPAFGLRGGMESFYGAPWSQGDLLRHLSWLGAHKMNAFQYTVSGDPRTSGNMWRSPYPAADLARFQEAITRAQANFVEFIYRINPENPPDPGQRICHSLQSDLNALVGRYQQLWNIGERTFSLGWDDVGGGFVCQSDRDNFNSAPNPLAAAQAHVVNHVYNNFIRTHAGAKLVTVPTEYWGTHSSTYRSEYARLIPADVPIFWTGREVISPTIPLSELNQAKQAFGGHQMLIFDNYPVNDYARERQHLGPFVGRDPALSSVAGGLLANEMQEAEASLISLFTIAEYTWNPSAYDPQASWTRSLQEFGGAAYPALRKYAENSLSSPLHSDNSPVVRPLVEAFRSAYRNNGDIAGTGQALLNELDRVRLAPSQMRSQMTGNPSFLNESQPWFVALERRASAGQHAVRALQAHAAGNTATYRAERRLMYDDLHQGYLTGKSIATGTFAELFDLAMAPVASSVLSYDSGALTAFARGTNGELQVSRQTSPGSSWTTFAQLSSPGRPMLGRADVITGRNDGKIAFVRGSDNQLWRNWETSPGGTWHGWQLVIGGTMTDSPRVIRDDSGAYVAFARGPNNGQLRHTWQTSVGGNWVPWVDLPGIPNGMVGKPDVVVSRSGALAVFVRGATGGVWHNYQTSPNGNWFGWIQLQGALTSSDPHAVLSESGAMSVFIRNQANNKLRTAWQSAEGAPFNALTPIHPNDGGIAFDGEPELVKGDNAALSVYVNGPGGDNRIWTDWQPSYGSSWFGWVPINAGTVSTSPRAIKNRQGAISAYAIGNGNDMYTSWQPAIGSGWVYPWARLGGDASLTISDF